MFIRDLKDCPEFEGGDASRLRELFNPIKDMKDDLQLSYSLAFARVPAGKATLPHRLSHSEVYYILSGEAEMTIGEETRKVGPHQAVYIPPHAVQHLVNRGEIPLEFLCLVDPAWCPECEEVLS